MSLIVSRLKHHAKVMIGAQLTKLLFKQYLRGKGPAKRLVSGFSSEAERVGIEHRAVVAPMPVKKIVPQYSLAGKIEDEYQNFFLSGEDFTCKAGVFTAREVDVSFPVGMHQIKDYIIQEALPAPYLLTNPKYYYDFQTLRFRRKKLLDEGVLLSMPWHHNFYFWMVEILPRLLSYDRSPDLQHVPLIVPRSAPKFVAESLKLAGYFPKVMFLEDGAYRFNKLHLLSMLVRPMERASPDAIAWLNEKFGYLSPTPTIPKRVYVSRSDTKIRFVSNEDEISNVLSKFGFEKFIPSSVSLADQIRVFRAAKFVAGGHGAAFAHLAFATPNSTVIEFFSRGHQSRAFNRIAGIRGLKYGFLVGEPTSFGGFSINPDHLNAILSKAVAM